MTSSKTNRTLQEQPKYQDIESLRWVCDAKLQQVYKSWKVTMTGMLIPLDDRVLCDICLERIRPSKKLQLDTHEFDRT